MLALLIIGGLCLLGYFALIAPFRHWTNRGVLQLSVGKLWLENLKAIVQLNPVADGLIKLYEMFPDSRYFGTYQVTKPLLLIKDVDLIKEIAVKKFDHFMDHNQLLDEESDPLWGKNLLSLKGKRWKDMRATLSPSFTSSKMKGMFNLMLECSETFVDYFRNDNSETVTVELKDTFTRYATDIIASASFSITCNSLKERDNEFYIMGKEATNFSGFWKNVSLLLMVTSPRLANYLGLKVFTDKVSTFFRKLVLDNIKEREMKGIIRPDMIHLLIEAKKGRLKHDDHISGVMDRGFAVIEESAIGKEEKRQKIQLTDDDIIAQALIFFFAGFDTVSTLMCFTAYELAVNPFIQDKLRKEVDLTLEECKGHLTYEALLKMEYLDMVLSETLRKWPSGIASDRICVKPYIIQPEKDGEKPVHMQIGDIIMFPLYAVHRDAKFFPEPDRFDPERFSSENRSNILPGTFTPFGIGPRSCIGNRFALLETKCLFFNILKNFEIVVVEKSVVPIKLSRKQFNLNSEDGFWFGFKPRTESS